MLGDGFHAVPALLCIRGAEAPEPRRVTTDDRGVATYEHLHHDTTFRIASPGYATALIPASPPFTEVVLLGNLAIRLGKKIKWDAKNMKAKGVPEADGLIRRSYREGFGLPSIEA